MCATCKGKNVETVRKGMSETQPAQSAASIQPINTFCSSDPFRSSLT